MANAAPIFAFEVRYVIELILLVTVGDGATLQQISAAAHFVPKSLAELVKMINEIKKEDRLYVQTYRVTNGAIIGAKVDVQRPYR